MPIKIHIMRRFLALMLTLSIISCNSDSSTYKLEGSAAGTAGEVLFKGVTAGSFLPVLATHIVSSTVTLGAGGGEIIALY